jgi:hypothetical protein
MSVEYLADSHDRPVDRDEAFPLCKASGAGTCIFTSDDQFLAIAAGQAKHYVQAV